MRKIVDSRAGNSRRNGSLSYGLGTTRLYSEKNEMYLGKKSEVRRVGEIVFVAQLDSAVQPGRTTPRSGYATKDQDRTDRASPGQGRGD